jgi:hypothetical protein
MNRFGNGILKFQKRQLKKYGVQKIAEMTLLQQITSAWWLWFPMNVRVII